MTQISNQSDLPTDAYTMKTSASNSPKFSMTPDQKKTLGISAAAVLLGGAAWAVIKGPDRPENPDKTGIEGSPETGALTVNPPDDIDVAGKVTDSMSFDEAFKTAREEAGMGGVFNWHGRWYNTFEKEEWSSLSLEQRQEYTEQVTGEKLPVKPYHPVLNNAETTSEQTVSEPTAIEGHLNGQRVIGLDYNHDGVIDVLVMEGEDGTTYRVVDARGDDGLDTIYRYDALDGELTGAVRLEHPIVLSNDDFSQGLEENMSKEVVDSILDYDSNSTALLTSADMDEDIDSNDDDSDDNDLENSYDIDDDTYTNDGDVQDMDA